MDIKTYVLLGGGLLIVAVIAHGFWIAWQARREPLRLDIVPDLIPGDVDDMTRLRGELPNGGSRVVNKPEQEPLNLETSYEAPSNRSSTRKPATTAKPGSLRSTSAYEPKYKARYRQESEAAAAEDAVAAHREPILSDPDVSPQPVDQAEPREVEIRSEIPRHTGRQVQPPSRNEELFREPAREQRQPSARVAEVNLPREPVARQERRVGRSERLVKRGPEPAVENKPSPVEELLVIRLLALPGQPYQGNQLFNALRDKGMRYGDMNIFHKSDPMSKVLEFSVANAVEPGSFDLADIDNFSSAGLTFFMQLPGPELPRKSFDDMLRIARELAAELGGDLKDDQMSIITMQTVEHYRQRIADFVRRRLSKRA